MIKELLVIEDSDLDSDFQNSLSFSDKKNNVVLDYISDHTAFLEGKLREPEYYKNLVNKSFEKVTKKQKTFKNIQLTLKYLEYKFEENYDILRGWGTDSGIMLDVLIYYPVINITGEDNELLEHTTKDTYTIIRFYISYTCVQIYQRPSIFTLSASTTEIRNHYTLSHSSFNFNDFLNHNFGTLCLGDQEGNTLNAISTGEKSNSEILLHIDNKISILERIYRTESTSGGPYRNIHKLKASVSPEIKIVNSAKMRVRPYRRRHETDFSISTKYLNVLRYIEKEYIEGKYPNLIIFDKRLPILNLVLLEKIIRTKVLAAYNYLIKEIDSEELKDLNKHEIFWLCKSFIFKVVDGDYYQFDKDLYRLKKYDSSNNESPLSPSFRTKFSKKHVVFRGEIRHFKFEEDEDQKENELTKLDILPEMVIRIDRDVQIEIQNKFLNNYITSFKRNQSWHQL